MSKVTLGTDPEIVGVALSESKLRALGLDSDLAGKPIPGYFALGVRDPEQCNFALPKGDVGPDGGATEFRVTPTSDTNEMVQNIRADLLAIQAMLAERSGSKISLQSHYPMDQKYIDLLHEGYGKACSLQILGCDPDYSVYGTDLPERPDPKVYPFRTLGGHIHLEMGEQFMADRTAVAWLVAALDLTVGASSTILSPSIDSYRRKELYGWAGMVRTGIDRLEYRTLPAQPLIQTPQICFLMFETAQRVAEYLKGIYESVPQPEAIDAFQSIVGSYVDLVEGIVPAINTHNIDACAGFQDAFLTRLTSDATIAEVITEMRGIVLPSDFDLHGWE